MNCSLNLKKGRSALNARDRQLRRAAHGQWLARGGSR
jgi:hypothetical protein